jgi:cell surface protein SprA
MACPPMPRTRAADRNLTITPWGRVPNIQIPTLAFDNDPAARQYQDVGLDGLRSEREHLFADFLNAYGLSSPPKPTPA